MFDSCFVHQYCTLVCPSISHSCFVHYHRLSCSPMIRLVLVLILGLYTARDPSLRPYFIKSNFSLENFVSQHRNAFVSMQACAQHVQYQLPNEHSRVGFLLDAIQCSDAGLQAAMASVRTDNGPQGTVLERKRRKLPPTSCLWLRRHCIRRLNRPQPMLHRQLQLLHLPSCVVSSSKPRTLSRSDWPRRLLILLRGEMVSFLQESKSGSRIETISGTRHWWIF
jgi:hypothetical protein